MTETNALARPAAPIDWAVELERLQRDHFIIGPITDLSSTSMPEGFDIAKTFVKIEVGADTFKVGTEGFGEDRVEQHALTKSGIERLAIAAGAAAKVVRVDDHGHPYKCEYEATAIMRMLDGSPQIATASRSYDLTEDGSDYIEVFEKARSKVYKDDEYSKGPKLSDEQLAAKAESAGRVAVAQARSTMQRNAETKAKLRALRSLLGIRSKYPKPELMRRTFVALRAHFSGRSENPRLREQFALMSAQSALGATQALFGPMTTRRALPAASVADPPVRELPHDEEYEPPQDEQIDAVTGEATTPAPTKAIDVPAKASEPSPPPSRPASSLKHVISKGAGHHDEGKTFADAGDTALALYLDAMETKFKAEGTTWSASGREGAKAKIAAAGAEIEWRIARAKRAAPTTAEETV